MLKRYSQLVFGMMVLSDFVVTALAWAAVFLLRSYATVLGPAGLRFLRPRGWNGRHVAIVDAGWLGQCPLRVIQRSPWPGLHPAYFVDSDAPHEKPLGPEVPGPLEEAKQILAARPVDMVFGALPGQQRREVAQPDSLPIVTLTHSPQHGWGATSQIHA